MTTSLSDNLITADIMQKHVVVVAPTDSLDEAMRLMTEHHVSGLPVLDRKDRCIGVISASDILNFVEEHNQFGAGSDAYVGRYFNPDVHRWESIGLAAFAVDDYGETPVSEIMSRDLVSVSPDTRLNLVAQKMIDQEIHRILVLGDGQGLRGIITTVDFVRFFCSAGATLGSDH